MVSSGKLWRVGMAVLVVGLVVGSAACEKQVPLADGTYWLEAPGGSGCHVASLDLTVKDRQAWVEAVELQTSMTLYSGTATRMGNSFAITAKRKGPPNLPAPEIDILGSTGAKDAISGTYVAFGINLSGQTGWTCRFQFKAKKDRPVCDARKIFYELPDDGTPDPVFDSIKCIGSWAVVNWDHVPTLLEWFSPNEQWDGVFQGPDSIYCSGNLVPKQFHTVACTAI